jgi:hypothetical protein
MSGDVELTMKNSLSQKIICQNLKFEFSHDTVKAFKKRVAKCAIQLFLAVERMVERLPGR